MRIKVFDKNGQHEYLEKKRQPACGVYLGNRSRATLLEAESYQHWTNHAHFIGPVLDAARLSLWVVGSKESFSRQNQYELIFFLWSVST